MQVTIEHMKSTDWDSVRRIYERGIATGNATFETAVPEYEVWNKNHMQDCRLVARIDNSVTGWAALSPVSDRCIYNGVAEVSVYVDTEQEGKGIGSGLLQRLVTESEQAGI